MFHSLKDAKRYRPELQKAVENQEITITKAKRICSVIDSRNQLQWIDLARNSNSRQLEKAVATINPMVARPESARYINDHVLELNINLKEETFKMLEKVKALVSRKKGLSYDSDSAMAEALRFYLDRHDPFYKAKRLLNKKSKVAPKNIDDPKSPVHVHCPEVEAQTKPDKIQELRSNSASRSALPSKLKYMVYLRDQGACQFKIKAGTKCNENRWLEVHHILPVSQGGQDQLENLITVCKPHHRLIHDR